MKETQIWENKGGYSTSEPCLASEHSILSYSWAKTLFKEKKWKEMLISKWSQSRSVNCGKAQSEFPKRLFRAYPDALFKNAELQGRRGEGNDLIRLR